MAVNFDELAEARRRLLSERYGGLRSLVAELAPRPAARRPVTVPPRCPVCLDRHDRALAAGAGRAAGQVRRVTPGEATCAAHRGLQQ